MNIFLYTTHCPTCKVLETKLKAKNIEYQEVTDVETMKEMGLMSVPFLQVDNNLLSFGEAVRWVNDYKGE